MYVAKGDCITRKAEQVTVRSGDSELSAPNSVRFFVEKQRVVIRCRICRYPWGGRTSGPFTEADVGARG